ncbi:MAG: Maf family protein [Candidatus Omnitrophica bacterium]|nr:Maf family protein [Candidatus Omnitrophota bacterium]
MRKIILASGSKARREILREMGLKFTVVRSGAKESRKIKGSCGKLVMDNALRKACEVARRFDSGIVIAADTVVMAGRKIIGKPKNLKDAFQTLKLLSKKPQWVYSGIAVVDIDNDKVYTDYERTKVYMYPLTNLQIRNYFKAVSPLDKAGSFDIQGRGGIFIDRIEGCFYNVVGLPLAKLAKMLAKVGIDFFQTTKQERR